MKKYVFLFPLLFVGIFFTACTPTNTPENKEEITSPVQKEKESETEVSDKKNDYKGLTVEEAQKLAEQNEVPFRVVVRDGEPLPATMDWRPGRINATVEEGIVVEYEIEGQESSHKEPKDPFDQNSWKEIIAEDCQAFFDGCNTCRRTEDSDMAVCTRKFCQHYERPRCLDDEAKAESDDEPVTFNCGEDISFTVYFETYNGEALPPQTIQVYDSQKDETLEMKQTVSGSGARYENSDGLVFWNKGDTASIWQNDELLYENCGIQE